MPRKARLDAPGLLQHVIARGIEGREIFTDDTDRRSFLGRLANILEETRTQCYAWALIPNHFHLLLRTGPTPLSQVMRRLMTGYAVSYNRRHQRAGHLFQNRYRSIVCEEQTYLLELVRYIHLNPLRAKLVNDLTELDHYAWGGHSVLTGKRTNPLDATFMCHTDDMPEIGDSERNVKTLADVTVEEVLGHFGANLTDARHNYRKFVEKGIRQGRRNDLKHSGLNRAAGGESPMVSGESDPKRELTDDRVLGCSEFVARVIEEHGDSDQIEPENKVPLAELIRRIVKHCGITMAQLHSRRRQTNISMARSIISYFAVDVMNYAGTELAKELRISRTSVSKAALRGKELADANPELWDLVG